MELDEFKDLWKSDLEKEENRNNLTEEKINTIMMNTAITLTKINSSNRYWWKFSKYLVITLLSVLLIKAATLIATGDAPLNSGFIYLGIIALFGLTTLWMYYELNNIFGTIDNGNLRLTVEVAIKRFKRWYALVNMIYIVLLPLVFFTSLRNVLPAYHIHLATSTELIVTGISTVVLLLANHLNFKATYFRWLNLMERNLVELREVV